MGSPGVTKLDELKDQRVASMAAKGTTTYGSAAWYSQVKPEHGPRPVRRSGGRRRGPRVGSGQGRGRRRHAGYYAEAVANGKAEYIYDTRDPEVRKQVIGDDVADAGYFGLKENLDKKREAVNRFMTAIVRAGEYMDPASDEDLLRA